MSASAREELTDYLYGTFNDPPHGWSKTDCETEARDIIAALSAAGFVIVPREPIARAHTAFTCVMQWIHNWYPSFTEEDEWTGDEEIAAKALRDLEAMVSAAEGKQ